MTPKLSKARYTERRTFQLSKELDNRLLALAKRDYKGDVQLLGRQALEARVDGNAEAMARLEETLNKISESFTIQEPELQAIQNTLTTLVVRVESQRVDLVVQDDRVASLRSAIANLTEEVASLRQRPPSQR